VPQRRRLLHDPEPAQLFGALRYGETDLEWIRKGSMIVRKATAR
jgi:hypothetical protein